MAKQRWKYLVDFKNIKDCIYKVSDHGDVKDMRTGKKLHKKIANKKHHPYYAVYLEDNNDKKGWVLVHQLVAFCFVNIPEKYKGLNIELVPDHLDNDGLNNFYKNLEWKTRGENISDAFKRGEINNSGENHSYSLISNKEAENICKLLEKGCTYDEILSKMGYPNDKSHRTLLVRIKNRIAWKDISSKYNFNSTKIQYTKSQLDTIKRLPKICKMIKEGYTNMEIVKEVWGDLPKNRRQTKSQTITLIRKGKIFKNILEGSSTIESISDQEIDTEKKQVE